MLYVLLVLHAVSTSYTCTVFLFRQTHGNNIGLFRQANTYTFVLKLYQYNSNSFQWKYQQT